MSLTFGWIDGKPYDFTYKRSESDPKWVRVYLGDLYLCEVVKDDFKKSFAVIVQGTITDEVPRLLEGFKTRWDAIQYALKVNKVTSKTYLR